MILVITSCGGSITTGTVEDLLRLQLHMGDEIALGPVKGAMHADQLILAAHQALQLGATHLGIVEHDQRFPPDAFQRLMHHEKPIIGANYWQRSKNQWTAIKDDTAQVDSRGKTGIEPVMSVGMGVMLIEIGMFAMLPQPWWSTPWMPHLGRHMGIDVYFGRHAASHGIERWVDHDLSQRVAHIADGVEFWPDRMVYSQTGQVIAR
jgi:hypothetical protein